VKISSSFTSQAKVAPTLTSTKKAAEVGSPKSFLQSISQFRKGPFRSDAFSKPTKEQLAGYDIHVVSAIRTSNLDKLKELHQAGKTMNACNQFGESLIHMACRRGDVGVVKFMLSCDDVKVNVRDDYGRTPLHDACWTSTPNFDVMELLLEVIDPELLLAEDVRGHTPFCYARREHWAEWVEFLAKHKEILEGNIPKQVTG
jgi:ankyrin repeat protein